MKQLQPTGSVSTKKSARKTALLAAASIGVYSVVGAGPRPAAVEAAALPAAKSSAASRKARNIADALERFLNRKFSSPGGKVLMKITPGSRTAEGHFTDILVGGKPAQVRKLRITELTLHATDVRIDVNALLHRNELITLSSKTKLRALISQDDLTFLLSRGKHTKSMGLKVRYVGDQMHVSGNFEWGWINGPLTGVGKLRLAPGHKVFFDIISLKLNGNEVPAFVKTKFSERINPVIDYEDIPFRPVFNSLVFKGPVAILTAG